MYIPQEKTKYYSKEKKTYNTEITISYFLDFIFSSHDISIFWLLLVSCFFFFFLLYFCIEQYYHNEESYSPFCSHSTVSLFCRGLQSCSASGLTPCSFAPLPFAFRLFFIPPPLPSSSFSLLLCPLSSFSTLFILLNFF